MCDIFGQKAAAAAAAKQQKMIEAQQKKHDDAVTAGKGSIDSAFSQFDDPYYQKYGQTYEDTYNPQLTDQYGIAKDKLIATLAGRDQLEGSVGANALGQLDKTYATNQTDIANKALDAENGLKSSVENTKTSLYGMNAAAADPLESAATAQAQAGALAAPGSMPSLGNVFAGALAPFGSAVKSNATSMNPYSYPSFAAPTGGGGNVVYGG